MCGCVTCLRCGLRTRDPRGRDCPRNPVQAKTRDSRHFMRLVPNLPHCTPLRPIEHLPVAWQLSTITSSRRSWTLPEVAIANDPRRSMGEGPPVGGRDPSATTPIPHAGQDGDGKKISRGERKARKQARRLALIKPSTTSPVPHPKQDGNKISQGERLAFEPSIVAEDGLVRTNELL